MDKLIPIPTPLVEGVIIPRHPLDAEVARQCQLARALAEHALDKLKDACSMGEEEAAGIVAVAKLADVSWSICKGLLAEQRERAKFAAKYPQMSDEEYRESLRTMIRKLTPEELDEIYLGESH